MKKKFIEKEVITPQANLEDTLNNRDSFAQRKENNHEIKNKNEVLIEKKEDEDDSSLTLTDKSNYVKRPHRSPVGSHLGEENEEVIFPEYIALNVKYCPSTYSKAFEDFKRDLIGNYTNIEVYGSDYPISPIKMILSKSLGYLQMILMILIIGGQFVRNYLNFVPEALWKILDDNKLIVGIFNFFIIGWLQNTLTATRAFEVSYKDDILWSGLKSHAAPTANMITNILIEKGLELA